MTLKLAANLNDKDLENFDWEARQEFEDEEQDWYPTGDEDFEDDPDDRDLDDLDDEGFEDDDFGEDDYFDEDDDFDEDE